MHNGGQKKTTNLPQRSFHHWLTVPEGLRGAEDLDLAGNRSSLDRFLDEFQLEFPLHPVFFVYHECQQSIAEVWSVVWFTLPSLWIQILRKEGTCIHMSTFFLQSCGLKKKEKCHPCIIIYIYIHVYIYIYILYTWILDVQHLGAAIVSAKCRKKRTWRVPESVPESCWPGLTILTHPLWSAKLLAES